MATSRTVEKDLNLKPLIQQTLKEDIHKGDVTTNSIVNEDAQSQARWKAKQNGIVAGLFIGKKVFHALNENVQWIPHVEEGEAVEAGTLLATIKGPTRALLTGERTALNFVQRSCGVATKTAQYAHQLQQTNTQILDTRKTLPGFRKLDKYAVKTGGGTNHRMGLYDMALIKENHITAAGGIPQAVQAVRTANANIDIEVETTNLDEVRQAAQTDASLIMLDNMTNATMKEAITLIGGQAQTEASGNITLDRLKGIAQTGVDYISAGALTHSVQAFDISQIIDT